MVGVPVLMVAAVQLPVVNQAERLPPIQPGQAFWAVAQEVDYLTSSRKASLAPAGTPYPKPLAGPGRDDGFVLTGSPRQMM